MIVPAMNAKELVIEIFKDYPNVILMAPHLLVSCRRAAIKSKNKYFRKVFKYKSPLKNDWLIIVDYYVADPEWSAILYYRDQYGIIGIEPDADEKSLHHFSPHFLMRYNERFLKQDNISHRELFERFVYLNPMAMIHFVRDTHEWNYRIFTKFLHGIGLGNMELVEGTENIIYHFKTFISNDMIFDSQVDEFNLTTQKYEAFWKEMAKSTRKVGLSPY